MSNTSKIPLVDLAIQHRLIKKDINISLKKIFGLASYIKGPFLEEFEQNFAKFIGTRYCVGVASGTDALHIALRSLGIKSGDEIILPVNTFVATAYAIVYVGAKPVFVDIDPLTFNIDADQIENKITKKTRAVIPVHLYGQSADMSKILQIAKKHHLYVIEDAAQAHGATYFGKKIGTFGNLAAFSFYPGKNLGAYGDGGALVTNSAELFKKIKKIREYGASSKYVFDELGFNSRLDALQASILNIKLKYLEGWNKKRQKLAKNYNKLLSNLNRITTPYQDKHSSHVYHLYVVQTPKRDKLKGFLQKNGIQTGIHYPIPLHLQKSLKNLGYKKGDFPVAEKISKRILSLPIFPELNFKQQEYIAGSIKTFLKSELKP